MTKELAKLASFGAGSSVGQELNSVCLGQCASHIVTQLRGSSPTRKTRRSGKFPTGHGKGGRWFESGPAPFGGVKVGRRGFGPLTVGAPERRRPTASQRPESERLVTKRSRRAKLPLRFDPSTSPLTVSSVVARLKPHKIGTWGGLTSLSVRRCRQDGYSSVPTCQARRLYISVPLYGTQPYRRSTMGCLPVSLQAAPSGPSVWDCSRTEGEGAENVPKGRSNRPEWTVPYQEFSLARNPEMHNRGCAVSRRRPTGTLRIASRVQTARSAKLPK